MALISVDCRSIRDLFPRIRNASKKYKSYHNVFGAVLSTRYTVFTSQYRTVGHHVKYYATDEKPGN